MMYSQKYTGNPQLPVADGSPAVHHWRTKRYSSTVKLGIKVCFDKEQIGIKELFMDYQPFYTIIKSTVR